jgi:hypothetical protein
MRLRAFRELQQRLSVRTAIGIGLAVQLTDRAIVSPDDRQVFRVR